VLFKHGFGYFIQKYNLKFHLSFSKRAAVHRYKKPMLPEVRLRKAFEELGGTYVKLGQLLSLRPDLVPRKYCDEFSKLQDKVKPFPLEEAKDLIKKELRKPIGKVFKEFEGRPVGSASIGQVHEAKLKDGKKVVVKIQRPDVEQIFQADIEIMYYIAKKLEKKGGFGKFSPVTIVKEFDRYTKNELNYLVEGGNIESFYQNLHKTSYVKVPKLYREYTTRRLLVMEFIKGRKLTDLLRHRKAFSKKAVMDSIINTIMKQVFEQDVFHADIHPGNVLVISKGKIGLLDFGIVGRLTPYLRREAVRLYAALIKRDVNGVVKHLLRIGKPSDTTDVEDFRKDVENIITEWHGTELRQVRGTHMLHRLFDKSIEHDIAMPVDIILLAKALVTVEGTCLMLNPRFNFTREAEKYIGKYIHKRMFTKESFDEFVKKSREIGETIQMIPSETLATLEKLKRGIIKIDIDDTDLRRLALDIDKSSNRLSYSMVLAALIVSAALMMHANVGPYYRGFPVPAMVLYIIAAFMCLMLFVSIVKEGALWR
jgi:ubiquinone biosynthesis protein